MAAEGILGSVQDVIEQPIDRAGGNVQAGVRGAIVNEHLPILARYPAVAEDHIRNIADPLLALRRKEIARRAVSDHLWASEFAEHEVEHVAQSGRRIAHPMGEVQPAFLGLDGRGAEAVLYLFDSVIFPVIDDGFLLNEGVLHAGGETPSDTPPLPA